MYVCANCNTHFVFMPDQGICVTCNASLMKTDSYIKENPKQVQAQKEGKPPLNYLVYSVLEEDAKVHKHGADKYGERNWRTQPILASTYEGAILRHFLAWVAGEDIDKDSGYSHLSHIRACCAVVLDSQKFGTLIDDRDRKAEIELEFPTGHKGE